jgi:hypothetical protein
MNEMEEVLYSTLQIGPSCGGAAAEMRECCAITFSKDETSDGISTTGGDGIVALAGIESSIRGDASDLVVRRDLVEKHGQHGRIAHIAGGELGRPDFQCLLVNSNVDLAPNTAFGAAMLTSVPFTLAFDLDA